MFNRLVIKMFMIITMLLVLFVVIYGIDTMLDAKNHGDNNMIHVPKNYEIVDMKTMTILGHKFNHDINCKCKTYGDYKND